MPAASMLTRGHSLCNADNLDGIIAGRLSNDCDGYVGFPDDASGCDHFSSAATRGTRCRAIDMTIERATRSTRPLVLLALTACRVWFRPFKNSSTTQAATYLAQTHIPSARSAIWDASFGRTSDGRSLRSIERILFERLRVGLRPGSKIYCGDAQVLHSVGEARLACQRSPQSPEAVLARGCIGDRAREFRECRRTYHRRE